jgi:hypothetical protein
LKSSSLDTVIVIILVGSSLLDNVLGICSREAGLCVVTVVYLSPLR